MKRTLPETIETVPWLAEPAEAIVSVSPSGSESLSSTDTVTEPSWLTVAVSSRAIGARFLSATRIVADSVSNSAPSLTVNVTV